VLEKVETTWLTHSRKSNKNIREVMAAHLLYR